MPEINRTILFDPKLETDLRKNGYAITPLFTEQEFTAFSSIVENLESEADHDDVHLNTPFYLSAFHNNANWKSQIYDQVYAFMKSKLEKLLVDYEPLVINIFDKPARSNNPVAIHQNPSFVEEPQYKSVSVWIPLVDVNKNNGTVGVLPGSHDVFDTMRAANMPDVFDKVASELQNQYFEPLVLKKGEAAILDDSMIHWSYPNLSDEPRIAVQLIMVPKETEHIYYYYNESGEKPKMDLYKVDKNFFFQFNCKAEPQGLPYIGSVPFEYHSFSEAELLKRVAPQNPDIYLKRKKKGLLGFLDALRF